MTFDKTSFVLLLLICVKVIEDEANEARDCALCPDKDPRTKKSMFYDEIIPGCTVCVDGCKAVPYGSSNATCWKCCPQLPELTTPQVTTASHPKHFSPTSGGTEKPSTESHSTSLDKRVVVVIICVAVILLAGLIILCVLFIKFKHEAELRQRQNTGQFGIRFSNGRAERVDLPPERQRQSVDRNGAVEVVDLPPESEDRAGPLAQQHGLQEPVRAENNNARPAVRNHAPEPAQPVPEPGAPAPEPGAPVPEPGAPVPEPGAPVPEPGARPEMNSNEGQVGQQPSAVTEGDGVIPRSQETNHTSPRRSRPPPIDLREATEGARQGPISPARRTPGETTGLLYDDWEPSAGGTPSANLEGRGVGPRTAGDTTEMPDESQRDELPAGSGTNQREDMGGSDEGGVQCAGEADDSNLRRMTALSLKYLGDLPEDKL